MGVRKVLFSAALMLLVVLAVDVRPGQALEATAIEDLRRDGAVSGMDAELLLAHRELAEGRLASAQSRAEFVLTKSRRTDHHKLAAKIWWKSCRQSSPCLARFWKDSRRTELLPLFFEIHTEAQRGAIESIGIQETLARLSDSRATACSKVLWLQSLNVSGPSLYLFQNSILGCARNLERIRPLEQQRKTSRAIAYLTQGQSLLIEAQVLARRALGQNETACQEWIQHQGTQDEIDFGLANKVCRSARLKSMAEKQLSDKMDVWAQQAIENPTAPAMIWLQNQIDSSLVRHATIRALMVRKNNSQDIPARSIVLSTGARLLDSDSGKSALRAWVPIRRDSLDLWNELPDSDWSESEKLSWIKLGLFSNSTWVERAVRMAEVLEPRPWARLVRFPNLAIGLSQSSALRGRSLAWASAVALQAIDEPRLLETLTPTLQESPFFLQMMDIYGYIRSFEVSSQLTSALPIGLDPKLRSDLQVLTRIGQAKQAHQNKKLASSTSRHLKKLAESHRWTFEPLQELVTRWLETMSKS